MLFSNKFNSSSKKSRSSIANEFSTRGLNWKLFDILSQIESSDTNENVFDQRLGVVENCRVMPIGSKSIVDELVDARLVRVGIESFCDSNESEFVFVKYFENFFWALFRLRKQGYENLNEFSDQRLSIYFTQQHVFDGFAVWLIFIDNDKVFEVLFKNSPLQYLALPILRELF